MFELSIQDLSNDDMLTNTLQLTPSTDYTVTGIDGLAPPPANVVGASLTSTDGQLINVHRIDVRDIVITVYINNPVEINRIKLYDFLHTKQNVRLCFKNGTRDVIIEGYVENFECDLFSMRQVAQITIKCLDPFFMGTTPQHLELFTTEDKFQFAFKIPDPPQMEFSSRTKLADAQFVYNGHVPTGCEIQIQFDSEYNGIIKITDAVQNKSMSINHHFLYQDIVRINTNPGHKNIAITRNGQTSNLINALVDGSTWLTINRGKNSVVVTTPTNKASINVIRSYMTVYNKYLGV